MIFFWIVRMSGCISQECIRACFPCRSWEKLCVSEEGWLAFERDYSLQPVIGVVDKSIPVPSRVVRVYSNVCVRVFICTRIRVTVFRVSVLRSVVFLSPGRWFGFLARSSASPSVVVVDPLLRLLRFFSYCLEKNQERCTRAEAHCFESFSSSRMFFILQMARGTSIFSSLVWWLERPLTCTRPTVLWAAVESATGFCYFVVFTIQAELPELKWSGRTCISLPHLIYFSNSCLVCTGVKMPLKGTVHPKIVHTSYLLQHAVSVYIVVRRAAEYQFWDT